MLNFIPTPVSDGGAFTQQYVRRLSRSCFGAISRWPGGRQARLLDAYDLVMALVFHFLQPHGTFASHVKQLTKIKISDEALAQRRARLPWQLFEQILRAMLRPLADLKLHPDAFYRGLCLVGIDGTMFSVFNTPWISRNLKKAVSRRGKAAFAKLRVGMVVELGVHNPLALRVGRADQGKLTLGYELVAALPAKCLLLADRLYGQGKFLVAFLSRFAAGQSDFLVRVGVSPKGKMSERLADGSMVLVARGRDEQGQVSKVERGRRTVRLWTSLLDERAYPAE
jgi:hypothetical protein